MPSENVQKKVHANGLDVAPVYKLMKTSKSGMFLLIKRRKLHRMEEQELLDKRAQDGADVQVPLLLDEFSQVYTLVIYLSTIVMSK
uniref:Uncharacterized protein n=1 Tax=Oryza rufipogon TaxID=4529 RepID=A0A0E0PW16_ORYRU